MEAVVDAMTPLIVGRKVRNVQHDPKIPNSLSAPFLHRCCRIPRMASVALKLLQVCVFERVCVWAGVVGSLFSPAPQLTCEVMAVTLQ